MSGLAWRMAGPEDAHLLWQIGRESFVETFGHLYSAENLAAFLACHSPESWHGELTDPAFSVRIGEDGERAAAYAKVGPPHLPFPVERPTLELRQFYVLKPWQGTGAAAEMMEWVLGEARARGSADLLLSVFVDNVRARRFYARYGFSPVGRYAFMVGSHADEDLVMRLELEPGTP